MIEVDCCGYDLSVCGGFWGGCGDFDYYYVVVVGFYLYD